MNPQTRLSSAQPSVIVYGPQGCGKTIHAERIRKAFGLDKVWDAGCMQPRQMKQKLPETGVLLLTNDAELYEFERCNGRGRFVVTFDAAMDKVREFERESTP